MTDRIDRATHVERAESHHVQRVEPAHRAAERVVELADRVVEQAHLAIGDAEIEVRLDVAVAERARYATLELAEQRREAVLVGGSARAGRRCSVDERLGQLGGEIEGGGACVLGDRHVGRRQLMFGERFRLRCRDAAGVGWRARAPAGCASGGAARRRRIVVSSTGTPTSRRPAARHPVARRPAAHPRRLRHRLRLRARRPATRWPDRTRARSDPDRRAARCPAPLRPSTCLPPPAPALPARRQPPRSPHPARAPPRSRRAAAAQRGGSARAARRADRSTRLRRAVPARSRTPPPPAPR